MKRFLFCYDITAASGTQIFYVDAKNKEEAEKKIRAGDGEIYADNCEVTDLGEPEFAGETTIDDFGDFTSPAPEETP